MTQSVGRSQPIQLSYSNSLCVSVIGFGATQSGHRVLQGSSEAVYTPNTPDERSSLLSKSSRTIHVFCQLRKAFTGVSLRRSVQIRSVLGLCENRIRLPLLCCHCCHNAEYWWVQTLLLDVLLLSLLLLLLL